MSNTPDPTESRQNASRLAVAAVLAAAIVAAVFLWPRDDADTTEDALATAAEFMAARTSGDATGIRAVLAPNVAIVLAHEWIDRPADYDALIAWEQAAGWTMEDPQCTSIGPEKVACGYTLETTLSRALGTGPYTRSRFILDVTGGQISRVTHDRLGAIEPLDIGAWMVDTWFLGFKQWLLTEHGDDAALMINADTVPGTAIFAPVLSAESRALWQRHIETYVATEI